MGFSANPETNTATALDLLETSEKLATTLKIITVCINTCKYLKITMQVRFEPPEGGLHKKGSTEISLDSPPQQIKFLHSRFMVTSGKIAATVHISAIYIAFFHAFKLHMKMLNVYPSIENMLENGSADIPYKLWFCKQLSTSRTFLYIHPFFESCPLNRVIFHQKRNFRKFS